MKKAICTITILLCLSTVLGCSLVSGKGDAEKVAESLLSERIEKGGFGSDRFYSEEFWIASNRGKWENINKLVNNAMGNLKSYKLQTWGIKTQAKINDLSGTIVQLVYETTYDKGTVTETIILHKPLSENTFTIIGYNFNSTEIQNLIDKGIEKAASTSSQ